MTASMHTPLGGVLNGQYSPIDDDVAAAWRRAGWWEGRSIRSLLTAAAERHGDRTALVGHRSDGRRVTRSYREFDDNAAHAADVFAALGVSPGDAVAVMLPNWVEYAEMVFGINEIGAIYVGIPVSYGEKQVAAILRNSKAKVLVIPRCWRSTEHLALSRTLRAEIATLEHVVVLDEDVTGLIAGETSWSSHVGERAVEMPVLDPANVCYLGFTSGTTGEPKGAMHSHDTLIYSLRRQAEHVGRDVYGTPMVQLVASPAGHHTGFAFGIVLPVLLAGTAVHVDRWDPAWGVQVIRSEKITAFFGAPTFLQDMMRTDLAGDPECPLECVVLGGGPVPRNLPAQAQAALGAYISPMWGLTECGSVTSCTPQEPSTIQRSDGSVFAGSVVRVVDIDGADLPLGAVGDVVVRGPGVFHGYLDRPDATAEAFLPGLWFKTGDRASIDDHGWLSLHGRTKDIIIRGGENIPVAEVESAILDHPAVVHAAVVGVADTRLGERVCAVLTLENGQPEPTVQSLGQFLLTEGLSKHYLPEQIEILARMPMTPAGKIQKYKLREMLA